MLGVAPDDEAPLDEVEPDWPAPAAPLAGALRFFCWPLVAPLLSLLEPALAPVDSREALPAEAPETSDLELFELLLLGAVLLESLGAPADELLLGPAPPAEGELWAKAPVAAPETARAATAQSVVIVRILGILLRAPSD